MSQDKRKLDQALPSNVNSEAELIKDEAWALMVELYPEEFSSLERSEAAVIMSSRTKGTSGWLDLAQEFKVFHQACEEYEPTVQGPYGLNEEGKDQVMKLAINIAEARQSHQSLKNDQTQTSSWQIFSSLSQPVSWAFIIGLALIGTWTFQKSIDQPELSAPFETVGLTSSKVQEKPSLDDSESPSLMELVKSNDVLTTQELDARGSNNLIAAHDKEVKEEEKQRFSNSLHTAKPDKRGDSEKKENAVGRVDNVELPVAVELSDSSEPSTKIRARAKSRKRRSRRRASRRVQGKKRSYKKKERRQRRSARKSKAIPTKTTRKPSIRKQVSSQRSASSQVMKEELLSDSLTNSMGSPPTPRSAYSSKSSARMDGDHLELEPNTPPAPWQAAVKTWAQGKRNQALKDLLFWIEMHPDHRQKMTAVRLGIAWARTLNNKSALLKLENYRKRKSIKNTPHQSSKQGRPASLSY